MIGLPSLAALDHSATTRIWLATAPADMRCGFDRLAELAQVVTNQNPMDGHLFLFRGRRWGPIENTSTGTETDTPSGTSGWRKASSNCRESKVMPRAWNCVPANWR